MNHYCVYTSDPHFLAVAKYITEKNFRFEPHLNRTRFWVPEADLYDLLTKGFISVRLIMLQDRDNKRI